MTGTVSGSSGAPVPHLISASWDGTTVAKGAGMNESNRTATERWSARETAARRAWDQSDYQRTVTLMLEAHGAEVLAYVRGVSQAKLADDIYGQVVLDLWQGIRTFQWRCSVRTYLFALARHAVSRMHLIEGRAARRERAYAESTWLWELVSQLRTPTPPYLRSEVKLRVRELRTRLSAEEQTLLVLRVDRGMSFKDLAVVMEPLDRDMSGAEVRRVAARLRKRFQTVKEKLRRMMLEEGLLPADEERPSS